jgi:hypothetical protein
MGVVVPFGIMAAVLLIRGDSRFPLSKETPIPTLMFFVLAHTLVFAAAFLLWSFHCRKSWHAYISKAETTYVATITILLAGGGGILLSFILHWLQAKRFASIGYYWTEGLWLTMGISSLTLLIMAAGGFFKKTLSLSKISILILLSAFILKIPPILDFPLTVFRSDMLLNIKVCGQDILTGISPYHHHTLGPYLLPNVRLPAMILAYLPSIFLNIDPRWIKLGYEIVCVVLLWVLVRRLPIPIQSIALVLIVLFWTNPYLAFRHEIYDAPFWLFILLTMITLKPSHFLINGVLVGILASMHQWAWAAAPFFFAYQFRSLSLKKIFLWSSCFLITWSLIMGPFLLNDLDGFLGQLFGAYGIGKDFICDTGLALPTGWERIRDANPYSMSLYSWIRISDFGFTHGTHILAFCLLCTWITSLWIARERIDRLLSSISFVWLLTLWLSPVGWTYQYFTILFYILVFQLMVWEKSFKI